VRGACGGTAAGRAAAASPRAPRGARGAGAALGAPTPTNSRVRGARRAGRAAAGLRDRAQWLAGGGGARGGGASASSGLGFKSLLAVGLHFRVMVSCGPGARGRSRSLRWR
jgi:hypothetical protein